MASEESQPVHTLGNTLSRNSILVALGVVVTVGVVGVALSPLNATSIIGFATIVCVSLLSELRRIGVDAEQKEAARKTSNKLDVAAEKVEDVKNALGVSDVKVEEVKTALAVQENKTTTKLDDLAKVADENKKTIGVVHSLVNSSMGVQLKIAMLALRRVADLTKHPDDVAAADLAEKNFHEHEENQANIDAKEAAKAKQPLVPETPTKVQDVNIVSSQPTIDVKITPSVPKRPPMPHD